MIATSRIAGVRQVGLRLGAVDLVRDQDRGAEQGAREQPASCPRGGSQMIERRADPA